MPLQISFGVGLMKRDEFRRQKDESKHEKDESTLHSPQSKKKPVNSDWLLFITYNKHICHDFHASLNQASSKYIEPHLYSSLPKNFGIAHC